MSWLLFSIEVMLGFSKILRLKFLIEKQIARKTRAAYLVVGLLFMPTVFLLFGWPIFKFLPPKYKPATSFISSCGLSWSAATRSTA
jgi:hypothetical protein